jgi:hypothetical protein
MSIKVTFANNDTGRAMKQALQPQKYITITLTQDQLNQIINDISLSIWDAELNDKDFHSENIAFRKRLLAKLAQHKVYPAQAKS